MTKAPLALTEPAHLPGDLEEPAETPGGAASFSWHTAESRTRAPYQSERADDIADRLDAKYLDWQRQQDLNFADRRRHEVTIFTMVGWVWKYRAGRIALITLFGLLVLAGLVSSL